jgi:molecular chaperone DnaJ
VTVEVVVPDQLSDEARAAVEALRAQSGGTDPRAGLFSKAGS